MVFDNTKIKRLVPEYVASIPFSRGAEEIVAWYDDVIQPISERMRDWTT